MRPNIWLIDAKMGWKTVEASKKDVPAQRASVAEPCRLLAIMDSATLRDVASRAAAKIITQRATKTIINLPLGLNSFD